MVTDQLPFVYIAPQPLTVLHKKLNTMLGASSNTEIAPRLWRQMFQPILKIWWLNIAQQEISFMRLDTHSCLRIVRLLDVRSQNVHWWMPPVLQLLHLTPISGWLSVAPHGHFQPKEAPSLDGALKLSVTNVRGQHKLDFQKIPWLAGL